MAQYSAYNEMNRYQNLDLIEWSIVNHLIHSHSKYAELLWKMLKYPTIDCLLRDNVTEAERMTLIDVEDGGESTKNVFFVPFNNDAYTAETASIHIYVDSIKPITDVTSSIRINVDTVTHIKIAKILGDHDAHELNSANPLPNPNDENPDGTQMVLYKSRATTMLKSILAELSGLYIDGAGYLQLLDKPANKESYAGGTKQDLFNGKSYFGHTTTFTMVLSGASDSSSWGF